MIILSIGLFTFLFGLRLMHATVCPSQSLHHKVFHPTTRNEEGNKIRQIKLL